MRKDRLNEAPISNDFGERMVNGVLSRNRDNSVPDNARDIMDIYSRVIDIKHKVAKDDAILDSYKGMFTWLNVEIPETKVTKDISCLKYKAPNLTVCIEVLPPSTHKLFISRNDLSIDDTNLINEYSIMWFLESEDITKEEIMQLFDTFDEYYDELCGLLEVSILDKLNRKYPDLDLSVDTDNMMLEE